MMVDDDPSVSYAPLRVHDFDLEACSRREES